ncbi:amino acid adenylation domain-containing protein [Phyllobacterium sp. K27]
MGACDQQWHQWLFRDDGEEASVLEIIDLAGERDWKERLKEEGERIQRSLDLSTGPLMRAGYFTLPDGDGRLLLAIHHLAVDGVSWRIILEDLQEAYGRAEAGEVITLPSRTTPWSVWATKLGAYAASPEVTAELGWWRGQLDGAIAELPIDEPEDADRTIAASSVVGIGLDRKRTRQLLQEAPRAYGTQADEVLLAALARTISEWSGKDGVLIELEGHGREHVIDEVDLSRTVGWFTTQFPVWLEAHADPREALIAAKERLRSIPDKGFRFGLLRHLADDRIRADVAALPVPKIGFNYLGQFDQAIDKGGRFGFATESAGASVDPASAMSHVLDLNGLVADGKLSLSWRFSPGVIAEETVRDLAAAFEQNLAALIDHCSTARPTRTASDFPLAGLSQSQLELLNLPLDDVQDIYPATPVQQGLIFHSMLQGEGVYIYQLRLGLSGDLDRDALRNAWASAIARHDILRTHFEWRHGGEALQVVHRSVPLPYAEHDWSAETAASYEEKLAAWRADDLARGFDLAEAPLMRVNLFARPDGGHDLVWTNHHVLTDGWGTAQLMGEIIQDYGARREGRTADLPAPVPYRDYLAWLRRQPSPEAWWRAQIERLDEPATLTQSLGRPRHPEPGVHHRRTVIDADLAERLRQAAQTHQVTLNTLMQGAWAILLSRYGNRPQVAFGATVSGRPAELPGVERMLGLFINSLPIFVDVPGDASVGPWLRDLQARNTELRAYEHTPLADLQQWTGRTGDALFDTLVVFENYPVDQELRKADTGLATTAADTAEKTHYPLTVTVVPGGAVEIKWSWDGQRFDDDAIGQIGTDYAEILTSLAEALDVGQPLRTVRPKVEAPQAPLADHPFRAVIDRIAEQAALRPDAEALTCEGERISYGELDGWSNRIGRRLKALGVRPEERVGLAVERSTGLMAGVLGILKAGGAYVPLDPSYPADRLRHMIEDSGLTKVVADAASAEVLGDLLSGLDIVIVSDLDAESSAGWDEPVHADQLAYVIYTSGSTGTPKGVGVTHANIARLLDATARWFRFGPEDVWPLFHSYAFDVSVWELFHCLATGGRLVVVPFWTSRDTPAFHRLLREEKVTVLNQTPSAFLPLMQEDLRAEAPFTTVKVIIFAGEKLEPAALRTWLEKRGKAAPRLINMYGITETTVHVTYRPVTLDDTGGEARSLIGEPIPDLSLAVLDADLNVVPLGATGELHVGGAGLARGYLGRPGLTAERFIPDPSVPGGRLYRSGDLARRLPDDELEYIGRNDFQVKIRGHRIELGEIQAALLAHPDVREAAVLAIDDHDGGKRLAAYVVAAGSEEQEPSAEDLREHLADRLPAYMVPSAVAFLDAMPLTVNGKLDRRALPEPETALITERVAPRNETEARLLAVWKAVLKRDDIGVTDNFFMLGGDSIGAVRLRFHVEHQFSTPIELQTIFQSATVAELASALQANLLKPSSETNLMENWLSAHETQAEAGEEEGNE